jgi:ABC-type sugar transport system substrate-binding protein
MSRLVDNWRVGLVAVFVMMSGCDVMSTPTPRKPRLTAPAATAKTVFLVLADPLKLDEQTWLSAAQKEAGLQKLIFRAVGPVPGTSETQADIVAKAIADGASALVVIPGSDPKLPDALANAESRSVPVVLVGEPVAAPAGSKPFPLVTFASFDEPAKQILEAMAEDARRLGYPTDGSALLISSLKGDRFTSKRTAALRRAAEKIGLKSVDLVEIDNLDPKLAQEKVAEAIKTHPDCRFILAADDDGIDIPKAARNLIKPYPFFVLGGFYGARELVVPPTYQLEAATADIRLPLLVRTAVKLAGERARGEEVASRTEQETRAIRGKTPKANIAYPQPSPILEYDTGKR